MSLRDLLALYLVLGIACAIAVFRRSRANGARAVLSALVTIPLWPLWAPFALAPGSAHGEQGALYTHRPELAAVRRVESALSEAAAAAAGTPLGDVFSRQVAARISSEVARIGERLKELFALSERIGIGVDASARRLEYLERACAPERAIATARLQHDSLIKLAKLRAADIQALEELADLLEALRMQLVLARYAGSSADGASAIVSEVRARLEGLGAALDPG